MIDQNVSPAPVATGGEARKSDHLDGITFQDNATATDPQVANSNARSWKVFADLIAGAWQKQAGAIIEVGRLLLHAKQELTRDGFEGLLRLKLPFDSSVARKLMLIAENQTICAHVHKLPPSWGTLYELSKLKDGLLRAAIEDGRINPKTERKDALAFRGLPPKAPKKSTPLLLAWRAASDKEKIALLDIVSVADFLKVMSLAFRRELEGRLREEKNASTDHRVTTAFRLALGHVQSADTPEASKPVAQSQEAAALAALRGIIRIHPNLHDLVVRVLAAESMKRRRAA
jgi:hypothetical protein